MFLKNNKNRFSLAGQGSEISNHFLKELIHLNKYFANI